MGGLSFSPSLDLGLVSIFYQEHIFMYYFVIKKRGKENPKRLPQGGTSVLGKSQR